jgi:hypothetical protein
MVVTLARDSRHSSNFHQLAIQVPINRHDLTSSAHSRL